MLTHLGTKLTNFVGIAADHRKGSIIFRGTTGADRQGLVGRARLIGSMNGYFSKHGWTRVVDGEG